MSARNTTTSLSFVMSLSLGLGLLAACSTVPNNPNYQYSSKYGQPGTDTVQVAQTETDTDTQAPQTQTTLATSRGEAQSSSPTEQAYDADEMVGTPGYEMMRAQASQPVAPMPSPAPTQAPAPTPYTDPAPRPTQLAQQPTGPREVPYDYAQNMIGQSAPEADSPTPVPAPAPIKTPEDTPPLAGTAVNAPTGYSYTVKPGDTVYSLSRRLCVPITDITVPNAIGSDYGISIGETLTLPTSRC